jgi:hypothetical protein
MVTVKNVKIIHPKLGSFLNDNFEDAIQYNIFLNLIHSCLELKEDFTSYNGKDFLLHIPYGVLRECVILGTPEEMSLAEYAIVKSKMEKE